MNAKTQLALPAARFNERECRFQRRSVGDGRC
jgi:hypothetical protein